MALANTWASRRFQNEPDKATATVHIAPADFELPGSGDGLGDVPCVSAPGEDKFASAQETPEGHAVRLDADRRVTHITAVNARWLLERDGELVATLRDGRLLRLTHADLTGIIG